MGIADDRYVHMLNVRLIGTMLAEDYSLLAVHSELLRWL